MFKWQGECQEVSDFLHHAYFLQKEKKKKNRKKGFIIQIHSFSNACCLGKYCLDKWLLVQCICSPQLLTVLTAVAASITTRGPLCTHQSPHVLLLSPIQMAFITREILPTGASCAWKCHPEIQGRDNLLCVLVVCGGGLIASVVWDAYTLLTYFLTHMFAPHSEKNLSKSQEIAIS